MSGLPTWVLVAGFLFFAWLSYENTVDLLTPDTPAGDTK